MKRKRCGLSLAFSLIGMCVKTGRPIRNHRKENIRSLYIPATLRSSLISRLFIFSNVENDAFYLIQYVIKSSLTLHLDTMQNTTTNDDVLSSVLVYKQTVRQCLIGRKAKRRALLEERRLLLDPTHSNRPIHSLSIGLKTTDEQSESLVCDESSSDPFEIASHDEQRFDESAYVIWDRSTGDDVSYEDDGTHRLKHILNPIARRNQMMI